MRLLLVLLLLAAPCLNSVGGDTTPAPSAPPAVSAAQTFLIVLRLVPRLHEDKAWTPADHEAVNQHFQRLKAAVATGQVTLAGRTDEPLDRTFGLVIFSAPDEAAAREFMNADPCVIANVMTAELHPYTVALLRKQ